MVAADLLERLESFCRAVGGSAERSGGKLLCRFEGKKKVKVAAGWLPGGYRGLSLEVEGVSWGFVRRYESWSFAVRCGGYAFVNPRSAALFEAEAEGFEAVVESDPSGRRVLEVKLL